MKVKGKRSVVYCPHCSYRFYWPRGLQLPILILLYEARVATLKQMVGALGCTSSGAIWSLRKLRRELGLVRRHIDDDTGTRTYFLTSEGREEVEHFLGPKARQRIIASRKKVDG